ncbi:sigma 54-interacting transcriptional regulator, partial [Myxococcota bacterium]|nr:sigma 54-interacting transcriptional regulator [Myxococcota bacterium]
MVDFKKSNSDGNPSPSLDPPGSRARVEDVAKEEFIWGQSTALRELRRRADSAAQSTSNVLLVGETGTGKGRLARWMHRLSPRHPAPFIHFDCAAISTTLFETELFGHERGAFTGAQSRRLGSAERAKAGTLFLDEIGELGSRQQAKFLRLLEDRTFERVGGSTALRLRARVLAATNRHLTLSTSSQGFRRDLLHRLSVITLRIPPLRERPEDIPALVEYAGLRMQARTGDRIHVSSAGLRVLTLYSWPGNVRELMNLM